MKYVVGIDLGTTNSTVTVGNEKGELITIKNKYNEEITPSAVYFGKQKGSVIVGKEAKEKSSSDPNNLVMFVKREMGLPKDKVRKDDDDVYHPFKYWNKTFSPEEISALILKQLKEDTEKQLGCSVSDVIITCPAYFGDKEKNATKTAGKIAGFNVLDVIPEPTAAAYSYAENSTKDNETILVFDLGGGTFDVTIMKIQNGPSGKIVDVIATDGSFHLGGMDWDAYIESHVIEQFDEHFDAHFDYEETAERDIAYGQLKLEVERAKKELFRSGVTTAKVCLSYGGQTHEEELTRKKFATITQKWTNQCKTYCENVLRRANLNWSDIDTVLMVGSMSNCTTIQDELKDWCQKDVNFGLINPKLCVSHGAAIKACIDNKWMKTSTTSTPVFDDSVALVSGVLPASIGIQGNTSNGPQVRALLKRDQKYPCKSDTKSWRLTDYSIKELEIIVMEGESSNPNECSLLGKAIVPINGKMNSGDKLDVTLSVDSSGILQIEAKNATKDIYLKAEIKREDAISEEEVATLKEELDDFTL